MLCEEAGAREAGGANSRGPRQRLVSRSAPGCLQGAELLNGDSMIRLEAPPTKPSARSSVEAEGTIYYRWALTTEQRISLEREGWREVARIRSTGRR